MHKCEIISGEGNGKPLLNRNLSLENPLQDHQELQQAQRTTNNDNNNNNNNNNNHTQLTD